MAWEGYRSRLCKCNDFNVHGLFSRDSQPFEILVMLLERAGQVVAREEIQRRLWSNETFGDFENGLNKAISKLREALADSAEQPVYVETLPRRGYRFIASIDTSPSESIPDGTVSQERNSTVGAGKQFVDPAFAGFILMGLGRKHEALTELEKCVPLHSTALTSLKVNPVYDPLRPDPRFQALLQSVHPYCLARIYTGFS